MGTFSKHAQELGGTSVSELTRGYLLENQMLGTAAIRDKIKAEHGLNANVKTIGGTRARFLQGLSKNGKAPKTKHRGRPYKIQPTPTEPTTATETEQTPKQRRVYNKRKSDGPILAYCPCCGTNLRAVSAALAAVRGL